MAITSDNDSAPSSNWSVESLESRQADTATSPTITMTSWGGAHPPLPGGRAATLLCRVARRRDLEQTAELIHDLLTGDTSGLAEMLPTFAAVTWSGADTMVAAADSLGFRHLYQATEPAWAGLSTSAELLANRRGLSLDYEALAVQSQLGWQLGQRTVFSGVRKVAPGTLVTLSGGRATTEAFAAASPAEPLPLEQAVRDTAGILRTYMAEYLDDHPDAILQLTGGLDSRILLGAIPAHRRTGLRVVTLGVPGVPDLEIAAGLTKRYGMKHEILTLDGLGDLDDSEAYERCVASARQLDCSADPLAHASLLFAESRAEEGPRLSGLGGEVARGFFYHGVRVATDPEVTRQRSDRLARWRMFTNEAVEPAALDAEFASWARRFATDDVYRTLTGTRQPWFASTDHLYLAHRMQRWGGITETAVCQERAVVNPMLDDRFLLIARRLRPQDKRNARFLSRLLLALDPDLAAIRMDGRPPPAAYAHRSVNASAQLLAANVAKYERKAVQRIRHVNRPPAGGAILAQKVVAHWRADPALLDPLRMVGIFDPAWLDGVIAGRVTPTSSSVAFAMCVLVATNSGRAPTAQAAAEGRAARR